jgi:Tfp pilus assembly protein PilN
MKEKDFLLLAGGIGALLGGVVAILHYANTKQHRELQKRNAYLENQIKQLQLFQLQKENGMME